MNILQAVSSWRGGTIRVALDIAKTLSLKEHFLVTLYMTNLAFKIVDSEALGTIRIKNLNVLCPKVAKRTKLFITPQLASLKNEIIHFNVIHLHGFRTFQNVIIHHYARKYGIPYVLQAHGSLPRITEKRGLKWIYDTFFGYRLLRDSSRVIAISQMEAQQYRKMGVPIEKIEVIPNGIDLSKYVNLPSKGSFKKKFSIDDNAKIILCLGRIHRAKGINFLVKAYAYLTKSMKYNNVILVIAGPDDGYLHKVEQQVSYLKIVDKVVFTGMLSEKEKIRAYVDSDIVVNVEPRNVFGLVPLEAAVCSTPVIVSKGNAISNTVCQGKFGFSVEYGDVNELAEIMGTMLDNDDLLREMGQRGRKFIFENCNWADIVTKLEKVYEGVHAK